MRFSALRNKNFVIFTAGDLSATNAIWINRVIIGWLGWELTGLASWVGLLSFLLYAPIVLSPIFGVILDSIDPRRAIIVIQSILITIVATLLVLCIAGMLTIGPLSLVALAVGITSSADRTVRFVLVPRLVERAALANAIAIHGVNFNTARLIGPAIGGFLIDLYGTEVAIIVNLAMILPFLAVLFIVKLRDRYVPIPKRKGFLAEIIDGTRHSAAHPVIREAMILSGVFSITLSGVLEILPAISDGNFQRGAQGLGQMLAAAGAGAVIAAIFVAVRRSGPSGSGISLAVYFSIFGGCASVIALGATASWLVALVMVFTLGACLTINQIDLQTSIQVALSDNYRARVMSLWVVLVIGGVAISAFGVGLLADIFGMSAALAASSIACAVAAGATMSGSAKRGGLVPPGAQ